MKGKILIVPGYKGSPAGHWQTWLEGHYPNSDRLKSVNVNQPILSTWSEEIERYLVQQNEPVTLVAHSFGCLAAAHAIAKHKRQVNAALLVPPLHLTVSRNRDISLTTQHHLQFQIVYQALRLG